MQPAVIFVRISKKAQDYQRQVEAEIAEKISGVRKNQDWEEIQQLLGMSRRVTIQKVLVR